MTDPTGSTTGASAGPSALTPEILTTVVTALHELGREPDVDWALEVFDVARRDGSGPPLSGVVMNFTREVVFYAVHPSFIPAAARGAVNDFVTRQNTRLATAAFELDLDSGILSLRSGFPFPEIDLGLPAVQAILARLMDDVEAITVRTAPELERVLTEATGRDETGTTPPEDRP